METDFIKLAAARYSVRKFEDRPVDQALLEQVLQAGHLAPTACNYQPQRILVMREIEALTKLKECTKCHFDAPLALLVCYDRNENWKRKYDGKASGEIDASIVTTHMMLQAKALGLGSTWVMHFDPAAMRNAFGIPEEVEPVALLVMGYPADDAAPYPGHTEFRPISETVVYEQF